MRNVSDLLASEAQSLPLAEVLGLPPDRLLGVTPQETAALATLGVSSVFDLAMSSVFNAAVQIEDAADNPANAMNRFGRPVSGLLKPDLAGSLAVADLRNQPITILAGIADAPSIQTALGVVTVRDLSVYPPFVAAKEILNRAYFPEALAEFDPESPADLIPKTGEFPTERVQYSVLVLDEIKRPDSAPPLIDLSGPAFAPIDVTPVTDPNFGFNTLGLGMLLTLNQSWFMQGVTLGHLLHSLALAAGESTRMAVIDWSRKSSAGQTEDIGETEDLSQDLTRNRTISEVTEAVAKEAQDGFSGTESESTTKQAGGAGGVTLGPVSFGASASIARTTTKANSYATSNGSREIGASMLQQASDRTHQHAHAARTRRASVVREVSQSEHESVSTRVITNYNHMHALTVQYYEVVQIYRTETAVARCDRVVFVPFKLLDFSNIDLLRRFRGALADAALTLAVHDALQNFDTLEFVPETRARFPGLGGTIGEVLAGGRAVATRTVLARRANNNDETGSGAEQPEPSDETNGRPTRSDRLPVPPPASNDIADSLWETAASRLSAFFRAPAVRRGSQSLFVPADVRVEEGAVQSTVRAMKLVFVLHNGTKIADLSHSVALADIARIAISGSDPAADMPATGVLTLSRNGIVFPLELPTVTVARNATETKVLAVRAAGADVNLVQHLNDNRLHYSQAVFRRLDAAMIAGLLSPFSITIDGRAVPLVQVTEPTPLRIVGNALAFKINTDPVNDAEWRAFMQSRGIAIGQSKVDIVPLSSGGIFAEAVLGRFNCAEKLDITRFFNWQDSPIPLVAPEIAAIQTGSRATSEDVRPGQLSAPIVNVSPPPALPDPTGLAATLSVLQSSNLFRDMSGLSDTIKLATETAKLSAAGATSAGSQATESLKASLTADVERKRIAADLEKAKRGKPLADKNPTEQGMVLNKEEELKKKQSAAAAASAAGPAAAGGSNGTTPPSGSSGSSGGGGGGGSGGGGGVPTGTMIAPATSGSSALDRIIGNDAGLRSYLGMSDDSPVPTPPVTAEGVPLHTWDFVSLLGGWSSAASEGAAQGSDRKAMTRELIEKGIWTPVGAEELRFGLIGDRQFRMTTLQDLLLELSRVPAGSVKAVNIVAHARGINEIEFTTYFVYDPTSGTVTTEYLNVFMAHIPLHSVTVDNLEVVMTGPEISVDGADVKLSDVRKAFAADGELRVFNLTNPIRENLVQTLANLFQVRASGFIEKPVRVTATVIGETDSHLLLSRKIDVGGPGDPPSTGVEFFEHLLQQDRARTGLFTAFPRR